MEQNKSYKELMALQGQAGAQTGAQSNQMLDLILNRQPFQYDQKTDPAAQAARKTAALNARAVTQNTLGQHAAMTGGMPSTAAVSAAAQAGNAALQQGADRVAELQELAYRNYQTEGQNMYNAYAAMQQAEGDAWNRNMQEQQWAYQKEQDAKAQEDAEYQKKLALAQLAASYGDDRLLKELGIDTSNYSAGGSGGGGYYTTRNPVNPQNEDKEPVGGIPAGVKNDLKYQYGSNLPEDVYEQVKAQYGEDALIAAGFTKKVEQKKPSGGGAGAGAGYKRPGAGNNRQDMKI